MLKECEASTAWTGASSTGRSMLKECEASTAWTGASSTGRSMLKECEASTAWTGASSTGRSMLKECEASTAWTGASSTGRSMLKECEASTAWTGASSTGRSMLKEGCTVTSMCSGSSVSHPCRLQMKTSAFGHGYEVAEAVGGTYGEDAAVPAPPGEDPHLPFYYPSVLGTADSGLGDHRSPVTCITLECFLSGPNLLTTGHAVICGRHCKSKANKANKAIPQNRYVCMYVCVCVWVYTIMYIHVCVRMDVMYGCTNVYLYVSICVHGGTFRLGPGPGFLVELETKFTLLRLRSSQSHTCTVFGFFGHISSQAQAHGSSQT